MSWHGHELLAWQREALERWSSHGRRGVVEAVTGSGKTYVALAAARETLREGGKVLVLVPTIELWRQWGEQFRKVLPAVQVGYRGNNRHDDLRRCEVLISTVQSARDGVGLPPGRQGLLIADETHRYGAPKYADALTENFSRRLGLTATFERTDEGLDEYLLPYFGAVCYTLNYATAVPGRYVARYKLILVGADLHPDERNAFDAADLDARDAFGWLINVAGLPPEPFGEFMRQTNLLAAGKHRLAEAGHPKAVRTARKFLGAFQQRRQVLGGAEGKVERLAALAPAVTEAGGTLVFTETTEGAERAAELLSQTGVSVAATHSKHPAQKRRDLLAKFGRGELAGLAAPRILDEGVDVPEADLAFIVAATHSRRQMIQRMGRVLRVDHSHPDARLARLVVLYATGTSEDPAQGGHSDFLEEALVAADDAVAFPPGAPDRDLLAEIRQATPSGPLRQPGPIPVRIIGGGRVATVDSITATGRSTALGQAAASSSRRPRYEAKTASSPGPRQRPTTPPSERSTPRAQTLPAPKRASGAGPGAARPAEADSAKRPVSSAPNAAAGSDPASPSKPAAQPSPAQAARLPWMATPFKPLGDPDLVAQLWREKVSPLTAGQRDALRRSRLGELLCHTPAAELVFIMRYDASCCEAITAALTAWAEAHFSTEATPVGEHAIKVAEIARSRAFIERLEQLPAELPSVQPRVVRDPELRYRPSGVPMLESRRVVHADTHPYLYQVYSSLTARDAVAQVSNRTLHVAEDLHSALVAAVDMASRQRIAGRASRAERQEAERLQRRAIAAVQAASPRAPTSAQAAGRQARRPQEPRAGAGNARRSPEPKPPPAPWPGDASSRRDRREPATCYACGAPPNINGHCFCS